MKPILVICLLLIAARWCGRFVLSRINRRYVQAHAGAVPEAFREVMDEATYAKSVSYTLAKSRLDQVDAVIDAVLLAAILVSGLLPATHGWFAREAGDSAWSMAAFLFCVGAVFSMTGLPLAWYSQFRLEQRFGFNTTTPGLWWLDRLKGFLLAAALGYPLLVLVLKLAQWTGPAWWLWAWGSFMVFQLVMALLAPVLILPLFNKFTPLPEGELRERLLALAERTGFRNRGIEVMDGSRRSRHANAYFTGFGRFRKIVLFDTLVGQMAGREIEAVLAHEIGHFKLRHIPKLLAWSAATLFGAFWIIAWLAEQNWFFQGFGFAEASPAAALLLFGLLSGLVSYWASPMVHWWSRRHEYQADAFAARSLGEAQPLVMALRKLYEKNLDNLTPHPLYSAFYYSHPTLLEREQALLEVLR